MSRYIKLIDDEIEKAGARIDLLRERLARLQVAREVIEQMDADNEQRSVSEVVKKPVTKSKRAYTGLAASIMKALRENGPTRSSDLRANMGFTKYNADKLYKSLNNLKHRGKVASDDEGRFYIPGVFE